MLRVADAVTGVWSHHIIAIRELEHSFSFILHPYEITKSQSIKYKYKLYMNQLYYIGFSRKIFDDKINGVNHVYIV